MRRMTAFCIMLTIVTRMHWLSRLCVLVTLSLQMRVASRLSRLQGKPFHI